MDFCVLSRVVLCSEAIRLLVRVHLDMAAICLDHNRNGVIRFRVVLSLCVNVISDRD